MWMKIRKFDKVSMVWFLDLVIIFVYEIVSIYNNNIVMVSWISIDILIF